MCTSSIPRIAIYPGWLYMHHSCLCYSNPEFSYTRRIANLHQSLLTSPVYFRLQCKRVDVVSTLSAHPSFGGIIELTSAFEDKGLLALPACLAIVSKTRCYYLRLSTFLTNPVKLSSGPEVGYIQSTHFVPWIPPVKLEQICHAVEHVTF